MRAVLLPSIGDPFALKFWLHCFKKWGKNVDKVYVSIGPRDGKYQEVIDYSKKLLKDFEFVGEGEEMNTAFNDLLMNPMPEDTFLLIQDDAYIFDPGIVDASFRSIEEGWTDIVASNQFTYPDWLNDYITPFLTPQDAQQANRGLAYYPNFFFGRVKEIQDTETGIGVQQWHEGQNEYLHNMVLKQPADMDLMAALSLELRHKGLRWQYVPQYQDGYWEQWKDKKIPWTHVTGLSAIWNGIQNGVNRETNAYPHNIMLQRLTWHVLFYEMFEMKEIQWFADEYKKTINQIMQVSGVTREELEPRIKYFKELL